jgi:hypothetical protein
MKLFVPQFSPASSNFISPEQLKLSHYTPRRCFRGDEVELLLTLEFDTRWG